MSKKSRKKRTAKKTTRVSAPRQWIIPAAAAVCVAVILIARFSSGIGGKAVNAGESERGENTGYVGRNEDIGDDGKDDNAAVATVNGVPISLSEFMLSVSSVRGKVLSSVIANGGDQGSPTFWSEPVNDEPPIETLKKTALADAVRKKIIQVIGREKGLADDISYQTMENNLEAENKRRETALANNQPIYGPQQYSEMVYFDLQISELEYDIQQEIQRTTEFSEQEMYRVFQEQLANRAPDPGTITIKKLFAPYIYDDLLTVEKAKTLMDKIYVRIMDGIDFESAAQSDEGVSLIEQTISQKLGVRDSAQRPSYITAMYLSKGDISGVYEDLLGFSILKVIERSEVNDYTFEDAKEAILYDLAIERFNALVQEAVDSADIKTTELYDGIDQVIISGR